MQQLECLVIQYFCTAPWSVFLNRKPFGQNVSCRIQGKFSPSDFLPGYFSSEVKELSTLSWKSFQELVIVVKGP